MCIFGDEKLSTINPLIISGTAWESRADNKGGACGASSYFARAGEALGGCGISNDWATDYLLTSLRIKSLRFFSRYSL